MTLMIQNNQNREEKVKEGIKFLLLEFRRYLINQKIKELNKKREIERRSGYFSNRENNNTIFWIEKLLDTPISDFRKNATNLILTPYLVNIKKLSYQQSLDILTDWLQKCNSLKKLDFKPDYLAKHALSTAIEKRIPPMKLVTLKDRNLELYTVLHK